MLRTALLGLLGLLVGAVLVGCGSSEAAKPRSSPSSSPSAKAATYFTRTDTDAINKVAAAAQKAEATALARATTQRCDRLGKTKGYPAWRACWHRALTPVATTLTTLAGEFTSMSSREGFPAACAAELRKAGSSFSALAARVQPLVSGIDSEKRAAPGEGDEHLRLDPAGDHHGLLRAAPAVPGVLLALRPEEHQRQPPAPAPARRGEPQPAP